MTFAELVMIGRPEDYTQVDSRTILITYVDARERMLSLQVALELQLSLLAKEFKASGPSEAVTEIAERVQGILAEHGKLVRRTAAILCEVNRRSLRNGINQSFGQLKIGYLRNDFDWQKEALERLHTLFDGIRWNKNWFHKEEQEGINSFTNELLTKELNRHENLDLPTTIEHMMDNKFAYLGCAFVRDFMDEMDKTSSRPFENHVEVDDLIQDTSKMDSLDDRIHLEKLEIRLREAAMKQDHPVDREIILGCADVLGDRDLLNSGDRAIRAPLVKNVACKTRFSPQGVRGRLIRGTTLPVLRKVLRFEPDDKEK